MDLINSKQLVNVGFILCLTILSFDVLMNAEDKSEIVFVTVPSWRIIQFPFTIMNLIIAGQVPDIHSYVYKHGFEDGSKWGSELNESEQEL